MKRRIPVVAAAVVAVATAVAIPAAIAHADYEDPLTEIDGNTLTWHPTDQAALDKLDGALHKADVAEVLDSANHPMKACADGPADALPLAPKASVSACWDDGDQDTEAWVPQGISTSGEADPGGTYQDRDVVLSAWHFNTQGVPADDADWNGNNERYNDARVAFIDRTDPDAPKYRWTYLVRPQDGGADFSAAESHTGGIAWYGDKVFVTEVGNRSTAIRVFSMDHILQLDSSASDRIGAVDGKYAAYGYQYAMVEVGYYEYGGGKCTMDTDSAQACFSSISMDSTTSPPSLVATEYFADQSLHGRLYRYDTGDDHLLAADADGTVPSREAYRSYVGNMQGVTSVNGNWYVAHSSATRNGSVYRQTTSESVANGCGDPETMACWGMHPEALSYHPGQDTLWAQTEWSPAECAKNDQSCGRAIFGVKLGDLA